jgi:tellurite resistance protein TehA-like permease
MPVYDVTFKCAFIYTFGSKIKMKTSKILKILALLPVGWIVLVSLVFGIGESLGGDVGGLMHLVPVVVLGLAVWLC